MRLKILLLSVFFFSCFFIFGSQANAQTCAATRVINQFACVNPVQVCNNWVNRCSFSGATCDPTDVPPCPVGAGVCTKMCASWNPTGPPTCQTTGSQNVACNPAPACNFTGGIQQCGLTGGGSSASCYEKTETLNYGCWISGGGSSSTGGGGGGGGWGSCGSCSCASIGIGVDPSCRNGPGGCTWDPGGCGGGGGVVPESCQIYGAPATTEFNLQVGETVLYDTVVGGRGSFRGATRSISAYSGSADFGVTPVAYTAPRPYPFYITGTKPVAGLLRINVQMNDASLNPVTTCFRYFPVSVSACVTPAAPTGLSPKGVTIKPVTFCNAACTTDIDCGGHWVEGRLSRNQATFTNSGPDYAKYLYLYMDGFTEFGSRYDDNLTSRIQYSKVDALPEWSYQAAGGAPWYAGTYTRTTGEGSYFIIPTTAQSLSVWTARGNTTGYIDLFVDGKAYGGRQNLNAVDNPPISYPTPLPVTTGALRSYTCNAGACRLKDALADNTCTFTSTSHQIRLVQKPNAIATQNNFYFDAIIENGVKTESIVAGKVNPKVGYSSFASAVYSGGSSLGAGGAIGRFAIFNTTATNLQILVAKTSTSGSIDIYVDDVLTQTVDLYSAAAQYQVPINIGLPSKPVGTSGDKFVDLTWDDLGYTRFDLEVYPQGGNCNSAGAFCGRINGNNYRFTPKSGVSNYSFRVRAVNEKCLPYDLKTGAWSSLTNFTTDDAADVKSTVSEDLGGNAVLVGGACTLASGATTYTKGGTVVVSKGGYSKSAPISTTDGSYNVTQVPGGSGYTVDVNPADPSYVVTCPATGQYTGVTNPILTPGGLPFFVSPVAGAWFQTTGGDVAALNPGISNSIIDPIPGAYCTTTGCAPHLCTPAVAGNPATAGSLTVKSGSTVDLDFAAGNQTNNVGATSHLIRTTTPYVCNENYDHFYRLYSLGLNPSDDFANQANATLPGVDAPIGAGGKNAFFDSGPNLTIANPWVVGANRSVVVFVDGNLNINANITVPTTSFVAFIVNGNINIGANVGTATFSQKNNGQVQGAYMAQGILTVSTTGAAGVDKKFIGEGIFAACNGIKLPRDFRNGGNGIENNSNPASLFIYRPDFVQHTPALMKTSTINWKEASP
ncbi:MAG: hypothetical protein ABI758_01550 [Candidatus Woesebacteria bacterium]